MAKLLRTFGITGVIAAQLVAGAANPSLLGTSITILKENDLYGKYSNKTSSAILLEKPKTFADAKELCAAFSETLWSPEAQDFKAGVNNSLSYQAYLRKISYSQQFWVADYVDGDPKTKDTCRTIDLAGKIRALDCGRELPALCSHSAPISNETFWDTSEKYQVTVPYGENTLAGFRDAFGVRFMGIRYAENPGRFKHTSLYHPPGDVDALQYGSWCTQIYGVTGLPAGSEDCFFLNIATPYIPSLDAPTQNLKPVFFWIHGGGFTQNSGDQGNTDGVNLAGRGDLVMVKINYRLGHFGFLAINGTTITGNYGIGDVLTAMKWVKENIAAFGGDPDRITIGGDSAGAGAVRVLLASEEFKDSFVGAVMESIPLGVGPSKYYGDWPSIALYTALYGPSVLAGTGCNTTTDVQTCLTNVDATLLNSNAAMPIATLGRSSYPVVDNYLLKTSALPITGKGYAASVPILGGFNRDEAAIQVSPYYGITSNVTTFLYLASQVAGVNLTPYANSPAFPTPPGDATLAAFNVTQRVLTDVAFKCLQWATAYSGLKHHVFPTFHAYEFNRTYQPRGYTSQYCQPPVTPDYPYGNPNAEYFKCHSGEVDIVRGELVDSERMIRDENDIPWQVLAMDYWSAFIWNGDPNPKSGYLKVRGYWTTLSQIAATGKWEGVNIRTPLMRLIEWNGGTVALSEREQCEAVGLGLEYYETYL
ncbi:hypothetical protein H072_218 [Dactylellina haptotyla CBS 200.50]|uniref:Carboxylesterase type B domain-containing protein n=1 Tax=Dactylellina haptotyla (strain CBS 200.50) TaxID=1284197 RepID=S8AXX2_DACHA|nr:hypothetical protein H072_218 [Dactylellina haptotyla CBS 200.50]